ncbi:MAG: 30S ribosomal protein S6, partial [Deltaproteobacteria bacterium]|nr:30S ribosomal protein S6 [Deltaproteobacteria bacterium]
MREYETTFIVQPEISDEGCVELFARVDGILERAGATRLLHDDQGKRRLAYEIRKFQKGRYVTTYYLSEGEAVGPLERALQIEESVLRFLTVLRSEEVADIEARRAEAAEEERVRSERAKERAEREAAEEQARQEAATARAAEAEAAGAAAAEATSAGAGEAEAAAGESAAG